MSNIINFCVIWHHTFICQQDLCAQTSWVSFWGLHLTCEYGVTFTRSRSGRCLSKPLLQKQILKIRSCLYVDILTIFCKRTKLNCIQVRQVVTVLWSLFSWNSFLFKVFCPNIFGRYISVDLLKKSKLNVEVCRADCFTYSLTDYR